MLKQREAAIARRECAQVARRAIAHKKRWRPDLRVERRVYGVARPLRRHSAIRPSEDPALLRRRGLRRRRNSGLMPCAGAGGGNGFARQALYGQGQGYSRGCHFTCRPGGFSLNLMRFSYRLLLVCCVSACAPMLPEPPVHLPGPQPQQPPASQPGAVPAPAPTTPANWKG